MKEAITVRKLAWSLGLVAAALAMATTAGGSATRQITGSMIKNYSVTSVDLANHTIRMHDLAPALVDSLKGKTGLTGLQGPVGPQGAKGDSGTAGAQGPAGAKGEQGVPGATGSMGPAGPKGETGDKGDKGDVGAGVKITGTVETWDDLPASANEMGDAYIVTKINHLAVWDGADFVDTGLIVGPQGDKGDQGLQGEQGAKGEKGDKGDGLHIKGVVETADTLPTESVQTGDTYVVSSTNHLFVYDGKAFVDAGPIAIAGPKGDQGLQGDTGAKGDQGAKGEQGAKGDTGAKGEKGDTGTVGPQGPKGDTGAQGVPGVSGYAMVDGTAVTISTEPTGSFGQLLKVMCPAGKVVVGGGAAPAAADASVFVTYAYPFKQGALYGWGVYVKAAGSVNTTVTPYALCALAS